MRAGFSGQRIVVVGTSGSGKTTLAREMSLRSQLPHIELDALYWEPNWGEPPKDMFRQLLQQPEYGHLAVVHLQSQSHTDTWLATLGSVTA
ncbi:MAG: hypothetical protein AAGF93_17030 [Cyanobacteria bacterium P01_H01_bin.105]